MICARCVQSIHQIVVRIQRADVNIFGGVPLLVFVVVQFSVATSIDAHQLLVSVQRALAGKVISNSSLELTMIWLRAPVPVLQLWMGFNCQ